MQNPKQQTILAAVDPEVAERVVSRREALARGASISSAVAAGLRFASAPVALAALSRSAFGQGPARLPATVIGVLNFALILEELEAEFYVLGMNATGLIPEQDRQIFATIRDHELAHVAFLRDTLGPSARPKPTFNFTGPYPSVFTNYETFKAVAQALEDTGVRAYKGQAPILMPYDAVLTAALTIHSVEARHAAEVRRLRGNFTDTEPLYQGWINENNTDVPGAAAVYAGEQNTMHGGVDVAMLVSGMGIARDEVTEAFDEPLTMAQVVAIVQPFLG